MNFATIAPQLPRRSPRWLALERWLLPLGAFTAAVGLLVAFAGLLHNVAWTQLALRTNANPSLPATACFLFVLPLISGYPYEYAPRRSPAWIWLLTVLLWAGTAALALYEIVLIRSVLFRLTALMLGSNAYHEAIAIGSWGTFAAAAAWICLVIGGAEYHYRHIGQRASWRLFVWTVCGELAVLALPLFV